MKARALSIENDGTQREKQHLGTPSAGNEVFVLLDPCDRIDASTFCEGVKGADRLILLGLLLLGYRSFGSEEKDRSHPHLNSRLEARPPGSRGPGVY